MAVAVKKKAAVKKVAKKKVAVKKAAPKKVIKEFSAASIITPEKFREIITRAVIDYINNNSNLSLSLYNSIPGVTHDGKAASILRALNTDSTNIRVKALTKEIKDLQSIVDNVERIIALTESASYFEEDDDGNEIFTERVFKDMDSYDAEQSHEAATDACNLLRAILAGTKEKLASLKGK